MFDRLKEWIASHAAEGTDLAEVDSLIPGPDELVRDPALKPSFDRAVQAAMIEHDRRFTDERLPKMLDEERAKIRKELAPEETPEQRRIRELEERIAKQDAERERIARRDALRVKANEMGIGDIGLSPDDVEPFVAFGDSAEATLASFVERTKEAFTRQLDAAVKSRYKGSAPQGGASPTADAQTKLMQEYQSAVADGDMARANRAWLEARRLSEQE